MRAAILNAADDTALEVREDAETVALGEHEARIRIKASGVCHSDLSAINGSLWIPVPAVMGHEGAGVVEAVGVSVTEVQPGDHVVIGVSVPCGRCLNCTVRRAPHLCGELFFDVAGRFRFSVPGRQLAAMGAIGSFAEFTVVRREALIPISSDIPFDVAALLGCGVTSGLGAVLNTAGVQPHSSVVVLGLGGVGIAAVQGARIAGADIVLAVDPVATRRSQASAFGATRSCAPEELADVGKELTGDGFDYAFEAAGRADSMRAAYDAVRRGGTACVIGANAGSEKVTFDAAEIYYNEKRFIGSYHGSADFRRDVPRFLGLWRSGRLDLEHMITHRFPLQQINDAFQLMREGVGIRSIVTNS